MTTLNLLESILETCLHQDLDNVSLFFQRKCIECFEIKKKIEAIASGHEVGLRIECDYNRKRLTCFTQGLDKTSVLSAIESMKKLECEVPLHTINNNYEPKKKEILESETPKFIPSDFKDINNRVQRSNEDVQSIKCQVDVVSEEIVIMDESCVLTDEHTTYKFLMGAIIEHEGVRSNLECEYIDEKLNHEKYTSQLTKLVHNARSLLNASVPLSGKSKVLMSPKVTASILNYIIEVLMESGKPRLKAAECITLKLDPSLKSGIRRRRFDDLGHKTESKVLISEGRISTLDKNGIMFRESYKGELNPTGINYQLEPGQEDFESLVESIDEGIYVIGVEGMFASIDTVSGDFSLNSKGFKILDGRMNNPLANFTISGNINRLLGDVEKLSKQTEELVIHQSQLTVPSILVGALSIGGA